jgi:hypothetical protein
MDTNSEPPERDKIMVDIRDNENFDNRDLDVDPPNAHLEDEIMTDVANNETNDSNNQGQIMVEADVGITNQTVLGTTVDQEESNEDSEGTAETFSYTTPYSAD